MGIVFLALNILDLATTYLIGNEGEGNPIVYLLVRRYGFTSFIGYKALVVAFIVSFIHQIKQVSHSRARICMGLATGISIIVVAWNIRYLILR